MKSNLVRGMSLAVALSLLLAACGAPATPTAAPPVEGPTEEPAAVATTEPAMPFAGETVTIFTAADENQIKVFESTFAGFEERTGIDVVVEGSPEFETNAVIRSEAGDPYDILNFPQPGLMADMARNGYLVELNAFLTADEVSAALNEAWVDLGTVDGTLVGLVHTADAKSL